MRSGQKKVRERGAAFLDENTCFCAEGKGLGVERSRVGLCVGFALNVDGQMDGTGSGGRRERKGVFI